MRHILPLQVYPGGYSLDLVPPDGNPHDLQVAHNYAFGASGRSHRETVATGCTVSGLSAVHALYLERGGLDFIIGDGRLNYMPEYIWESYYKARMFKGFFAALDVQHIGNPAYNHDRGPLWACSLRLHMEYGKK